MAEDQPSAAQMTPHEFATVWRARGRRGTCIAIYAGVALVAGLALLAFAGAFAAGAHPPSPRWAAIAGAALVFSAIICGPISFLTARCPACGAFLGKVLWMQPACPVCRTRGD